jgi:hypothetical protein
MLANCFCTTELPFVLRFCSLQIDGAYDPVLEEPMLLRQQLEGSALPNEFKRAHFISPDWDEILLDVNRTVQVTKGGKVSRNVAQQDVQS